MNAEKIAITMEKKTLLKLDRFVKTKGYPSRSKAIQEAVKEKLAKEDKNRLARECAKLDPVYEQDMAESPKHSKNPDLLESSGDHVWNWPQGAHFHRMK